jgi:hypothetical protein
MREMRLNLSKIKEFELVDSYDEDGKESARSSSGRTLKARGYFQLRKRERKWRATTQYKIWLRKEELCCILNAYLELQLSPRGILYDAQDNVIIEHGFRCRGLEKTLERARRWLEKLNLDKSGSQILNKAVSDVTETDAMETTWSRHAMQTLFNLDKALRTTCKRQLPTTRPISILYMFDDEFGAAIDGLVDGLDVNNIGNSENSYISLDITDKSVRVRDPNSTSEYFDFLLGFQAAFPKPNELGADQAGGTLQISIPDAVLGCLRGHLLAVMWKMSLSPGGLRDFCSQKLKLRSLAYIATYEIQSREIASRSRLSPPSSAESASEEDDEQRSSEEEEGPESQEEFDENFYNTNKLSRAHFDPRSALGIAANAELYYPAPLLPPPPPQPPPPAVYPSREEGFPPAGLQFVGREYREYSPRGSRGNRHEHKLEKYTEIDYRRQPSNYRIMSSQSHSQSRGREIIPQQRKDVRGRTSPDSQASPYETSRSWPRM